VTSLDICPDSSLVTRHSSLKTMPIPQHPAKHSSAAHFEPLDHFSYFRDFGIAPTGEPAQGAILTYQRSLLRHIIASERATPINCIVGNLYALPSTNNTVVVGAEFGIGSPVAAMMLELLIAWGVKRFVSIGTAGGLQPDLQIGDLTICSGAVRDEGVSHHYLAENTLLATPSADLTRRFAEALISRRATPRHGPTWTTDAPFRETQAEIAHYQREGVLTVEMEAAALFAVAQHRGVEIASGFVVSDVLASERWQPKFSDPAIVRGLIDLFDAACSVLHTPV
jgi:uridine phosphorylase